jgi:hypothetical protein
MSRTGRPPRHPRQTPDLGAQRRKRIELEFAGSPETAGGSRPLDHSTLEGMDSPQNRLGPPRESEARSANPADLFF